MGPIKLPFNAGKDGFNTNLPAGQDPLDAARAKPIFSPKAGGTQADTIAYIAVIFNVPVGGGKVTLRLPTLEGATTLVDFDQDGVSRMVAVPFSDSQSVSLQVATPFAKGFIQIASSL